MHAADADLSRAASGTCDLAFASTPPPARIHTSLSFQTRLSSSSIQLSLSPTTGRIKMHQRADCRQPPVCVTGPSSETQRTL